MATVGTLDFEGFVAERKEKQAGSSRDPHAYVYVSDKTTRATFQRINPVELAVAAAVRMFKTFGKNQLLGNTIKVGPTQFPRVHNLGKQCAETLGIAPPTIYIVNNPTLNAATAGTNDDSFILVHSALVDHLSDEELLSVIGHECGHIHNNHVVYLTAMRFLTDMAGRFLGWIVLPALVALQAWSRRAEITCDRAGLLCSGDIKVSTRALAKLALGSNKLYEELNMEAFLEQYEEGKEGIGKITEYLASHPWLPKRVKALRVFAESQLFRERTGGSGGLTMDQVDQEVHGIIKVMG
ncbi:MAG: M48 family metallopeptidase [Polyangiaceae bacterium]|nr:M48 family metallopeptidase [Polyangiaceae bacterium]